MRAASSSWMQAGLGDVVCVEGDCKQGEAQVLQMRGMFAQLGKPAAWAAAVATINATYDEINGSFARKWIPFSTACCQIKAIGGQAEKLTAAMAQAAGVAAPASLAVPSPSDQLGTGLKWAAVGLVALLGFSLLSGGRR